MKWGFFSPAHIATLLLAAAMLVGLYFLLKRAEERVQVRVLAVLSLSGIAAIVYNLVMWGQPLAYLPLHLCSINALLLPFAVVSRGKVLCNLLLVWSLGALAALVLNFEMTEVELFSDVFAFYYFPHVMEFGIPILLFKLGLAKKDPRCIGSTIGITMVIYTLVHFANKLINACCEANRIMSGDSVLQVNYMFSIDPVNPLVQLFYRVIPCEYWYMYMIIPILVVYLVLVYMPQLLEHRRSRKAGKR